MKAKTTAKTAYFNSHAHVERDADSFEFEEINGEISTHTLTWSVTVQHPEQADKRQFQLTRSRGA